MTHKQNLGALQTRVQKAVDGLVASGRERGVQVAAYLDGRLVVSAVSGMANPATGQQVTPDTLFFGYTTGKGLAATAVHVLAERGDIDYDMRLVDVWPEYGRHGKEATTLRHVLTHSAGVPALPSYTMPEDLLDWNRMCRTIASSSPLWEPGTRHGYHAWTWAWLVGETVHRATGRTVAKVLAEDVARPLDADRELYFGVPVSQLPRLARLEDRNWSAAIALASAHLENFDKIAPPGVRPEAALGNRRDLLVTDLPAVGSVTARGLARMYAALMDEVNGVRLISPVRLKEITTVATHGLDWAYGGEGPKTLGYASEVGGTRIGYSGMGGSVGGFYPRHRLSVACLKSYLGVDDGDPMEGIAAMIHAAVAGVGH
ncbi:serine hydrolase domain-containing protein [Krasilnikovia sp. MM14-A1259]|uniref:serine hydrolase domain-containing protein n=1 Tax=Krasilnikovia sp. MM14-A1259 TaxID=3373539 RepID=UPI0038066209